ncbi:MAG: thiamine-phosphate kinase [Cyanobacteria bacterium J06642_11]
MTITIADLGEHQVLQRLHRFCSPAVGDDAAIQSLPGNQQLVVTTDVLVDEVHFSDRTLPPIDLGWRAAAVNLSDLAAMGATVVGLTVGLMLPAETPWPWLEGLYQGLSECLNHYGGVIIGGDLCRSSARSVAITALGAVPKGQAFYRHHAQIGQVLVSTGMHGASRAGLARLLQEFGLDSTDEPKREWVAAHRRPHPRFDAVTVLRGLQPTAQAIAVMDTSDGLADAVIQICAQSGLGAVLLRSQLPVPPGLVEAVGLATASQWCLYGGEDFELVLSLPKDVAMKFIAQLPGSQVIGYITAEPGVRLVDDVTQEPEMILDQGKGYQHF